jgi:SEC-C motif-containing protein
METAKMNTKPTGQCPCGSGRTYETCCAPLINGTGHAATPEDLMRSRYSAYVLQKIPYLARTLHPNQRDDFDEDGAARWSRESEWLGLEVISVSGTSPGDKTGMVEFQVHYTRDGTTQVHHELSEFRRADGIWYFYDGKPVGNPPARRAAPKVGRNDPCPCGSGRKYKKCCGAGS